MVISQQDRIPVFVAVARIFNLVIAGVYLEAWVLTAMMTAPFTTGEMSRRIERDDRVHIEYVPTQVGDRVHQGEGDLGRVQGRWYQVCQFGKKGARVVRVFC